LGTYTPHYGLYKPALGEAGATWWTPVGANFDLLDTALDDLSDSITALNSVLDPRIDAIDTSIADLAVADTTHAALTSHVRVNELPPEFVVFPESSYASDSHPAEVIGRPDYPYKTIQAAINAMTSDGGIIRLQSAGLQDRGTGGIPHVDLAAGDYINITGKRWIKVIGPGQRAENGGTWSGEAGSGRAAFWIRGNRASGAIVNVSGAVSHFELEGFMVENTNATSGHGIVCNTNYDTGRIQGVGALDCSGDGFQFSGGSGDKLVVMQAIASGCGRGFALIGDASVGAPNAATFIECEAERSTTNNFAIICHTGQGGARGLKFLGCKAQHLKAAGAGTDKASVLIRGANAVSFIGLYFEFTNALDQPVNTPVFLIREAEGGAAGTPSDWSTNVSIEGGEITCGGAMEAGWGSFGRHIDADACFGMDVRKLAIRGVGLSGANLSATNPAVKLRANTQYNQVNFGVVSGTNGRSTLPALSSLVNDAGTGNWGTYCDPTTFVPKKWGSWPT
jgi:hypothetical protein